MKRADFRTEMWDRLVEHMQARRTELLAQLEGDQTAEVTATIRGRLKELKNLLALPESAAPAKSAAPLARADGADD